MSPPGRAPGAVLKVVHLIVPQRRSVVADIAFARQAGGKRGTRAQTLRAQVNFEFLQLGARELEIVVDGPAGPRRWGVMQADRQAHAHAVARCLQRDAMVIAQHGGIGATPTNDAACRFARMSGVADVDQRKLDTLIPGKAAVARRAVRNGVLAY